MKDLPLKICEAEIEKEIAEKLAFNIRHTVNTLNDFLVEADKLGILVKLKLWYNVLQTDVEGDNLEVQVKEISKKEEL